MNKKIDSSDIISEHNKFHPEKIEIDYDFVEDFIEYKNNEKIIEEKSNYLKKLITLPKKIYDFVFFTNEIYHYYGFLYFIYHLSKNRIFKSILLIPSRNGVIICLYMIFYFMFL
jgi:hypothetical protein